MKLVFDIDIDETEQCSDMFKIWIENMINSEIEDTEGIIKSEEFWLLGSSTESEEETMSHNIARHQAYISLLKKILKNIRIKMED